MQKRWKTECAAVIPCLNEADAVGDVVSRVKVHLDTVFVVDDGSTDSTPEVAAKAGAKVIACATNGGKGAALNAGLREAFQSGFTWAVLLDGDGQHAPEDIPRFFEMAGRSGARLIVGNRMHDPAPMPLIRRFVNRWMSKRLSRKAGGHLPDTQCGFRLVHLPSWTELALQTAHFEVESEMLLEFVRARHHVEFVPIQVIYKNGASKIHPLLDTWRWFRWFTTSSRQRGPHENHHSDHPRRRDCLERPVQSNSR